MTTATAVASATNPEPAPKTRDSSVDALKGFAILCVVFGHAIQRNLPNADNNAIFLLLGLFEMPLFIFLSGYVLAGRIRGPRTAWVARRAVRLLIPFLSWTVLFWILRDLPTQGMRPFIDTTGGIGQYLVGSLRHIPAGLWYLPVVFLMSALLAIMLPLTKRHMPVLVLFGLMLPSSLLAQLKLLVDPSYDFGISLVGRYWPYFIEAFAVASAGTLLRFERPRRLLWLAAFPVVGMILIRESLQVVPIVTLLRWLAGFAGIAFSVLLIQSLSRTRIHSALAWLGNQTLGIYCAHFLFLRALTPLGLETGWVATFGGFIVALALSVAITLGIRRIPVLPGILLGEWPKKR